ncbi:hypothetical protein SDJN02_18279, partial [Cucurbita argyrosperma subsp. argyrosperma]
MHSSSSHRGSTKAITNGAQVRNTSSANDTKTSRRLARLQSTTPVSSIWFLSDENEENICSERVKAYMLTNLNPNRCIISKIGPRDYTSVHKIKSSIAKVSDNHIHPNSPTVQVTTIRLNEDNFLLSPEVFRIRYKSQVFELNLKLSDNR